mgnify:CR=1 FL=1
MILNSTNNRITGVLKDPDVNAYKPRRTDAEQGGIGGIGVENWILQNGGSFVQACRSFLAVAFDKNGCLIPFEEFKKNAKQYSEKSYKRIFTILHKRYPEISTCNAGSLSLYFERKNTYIKENIQYVFLN